MIEIKSEKMNYGIKFPTSINEITPEILETITANVKLPKHYCIVALVFNTNLFTFCAAMNSNKDTNLFVTPLLAKISEEDSNEANANIGDRIIIDRSSLERGSHIHLKTAISSTSAKNFFIDNPNIMKQILTKHEDKVIVGDYINNSKSPNIIVVEFKICPICDITASIKVDAKPIDPFLVQYNNIN